MNVSIPWLLSPKKACHQRLAGTLRNRIPWVAEEIDEPLQEGAVADLLGKTIQLVKGTSMETACTRPSHSGGV
ncbi:hypothetical protein GCM10010116_57140 [Microbispora rosea subsp. aerata]|nr:hypothetical protein GCM10010116_57140 [Microbispora rosea subsp. aerata]GIH58894.1 hypothetical protein Mro02_58080 [Microbispora rosea subsp. aerata]GLJ87232.1 hypothetical protein GCM10017588_59770 [Microbispora rosea subsp. aerata]